MPRLPTSVRVGPFDFEVKPWPAADAAQRDAYGEIDRTALVIRVRTDLPRQRIAETLLHEIYHAIWMVGAIDSLVPGEENIVGKLTTCTVQLVRDNPALMAWFMMMIGAPIDVPGTA
jgi:hypothetical protein